MKWKLALGSLYSYIQGASNGPQKDIDSYLAPYSATLLLGARLLGEDARCPTLGALAEGLEGLGRVGSSRLEFARGNSPKP